ncbi:GAF and ANTAR domain-containing protein [Jatrophihabitans sp. DSM 45814]
MGMRDEFEAARTFARIAQEMSAATDLSAAGQRIVELAKTITGCDSAALWTLEPGDQMRLRAATDPEAAEHTNEVVSASRSGVEWDCLHLSSAVRVDDLRSERRWPNYCAAQLGLGMPALSMTAFPLLTDAGVYALVLGSAQSGFFTHELLTIGSILADHAGLSLSAASSGERAANMELALGSNRRIGIALGVIMCQDRCTDEQAFALLRKASQTTHRKLRDVAEEVIFTGLVPEPASADAISAA